MAYVLLHSIKGFDLSLCKKIDEELWGSQHLHTIQTVAGISKWKPHHERYQ
jgi:hypothetical protein